MKNCICNQSFQTQKEFNEHLVHWGHISYLQTEITTNCDICYNDKLKTSFLECAVCKNCICSLCYFNIRDNKHFKCPFCRTFT